MLVARDREHVILIEIALREHRAVESAVAPCYAVKGME
jgi:hypothetical protein